MHWILQENLFKETEWDQLIATFERFDIPYSVHKVIPFIGELVPPAEPKQEKVICIGSYSMRHTAKANKWSPGVYDLEPVNFKVQLEHWGDLMLNADAKVLPFEDVVFDDQAFLRPIEDSKVFAGRVYDWEEFAEWQHKVVSLKEDYGNSLTAETLIQICSLKKIYAEYRFWIVDAQVISASLYKRGNRVIYSPSVDKRIYDFVKSLVEPSDIGKFMHTIPWQPHKAYVVDVCETDEGLKIVEINTINAAGFYAGNVQDIVLALEALEN